ncbi:MULTISPECIES: hypothetical protein [unclassified Leucobacter]|uniref:hypothetical protein n=1 Tax=unclassified Leucobacter TaxID=2621730 RepID=UPI000621972D|nr:hypothetical protein [Leucobacter sp. Ag1]KKI18732.1 hypothetical protein XM48_10655 [Leucobacter sp. Ag1]
MPEGPGLTRDEVVSLLGERIQNEAEVEEFLAQERRAAAEKAWDDARAAIRGIPHWANPETGQGGFDLQPLGPNETSEEGAFMEVMRVLAENPYRAEEVAPDGR